MQDFFNILSNFGFPVAVASYLLFRFEKKLEDVTKTNSDLIQQIEELKREILELKETIKELRRKR
jgi:peptidoglycan hydrolase CwlO-like protein